MADFGKDLGEQLGKIADYVDEALLSANFTNLNEKIDNVFGGSSRNNKDGQYYGNRQNYANGQRNPNAPYSGNAVNGNGYGYNQRQYNAYVGSNAGRAAYEARRRNMMSGQPHDANMGVRQNTPQTGAKKILFASPKGEAGGKILFILGAFLTTVSFVNLVGAILGGPGLATLVARLISLGISGLVMGVGFGLNNRVKRFKKYVSLLKDKLYASVSDLGKAVGKSNSFVVRDLKKMIGNREFLEGHLDDSETTMIASDEIYAQYRRTQEQADALKREKAEMEQANDGLSDEVKQVLTKGSEYIARIEECNKALPEEEITEKLNRLVAVISKIFERVRKDPGEARNLNQFMDYYLPTTWKLISAYREMEEQPVQGENIQTAKKEIRESLDTINNAFETLLDSMYKDTAWDVSTDISVMKSMMKQDGLTGSDFKPNARKAAQAQGAVMMEEK